MILLGDCWARPEAVVAVVPVAVEVCSLSLSNGHTLRLEMPVDEVARRILEQTTRRAQVQALAAGIRANHPPR